MKDHRSNIFHGQKHGSCIADILDLVACSTFGKTPGQALKEVQRQESIAGDRKEGRHGNPASSVSTYRISIGLLNAPQRDH